MASISGLSCFGNVKIRITSLYPERYLSAFQLRSQQQKSRENRAPTSAVALAPTGDSLLENKLYSRIQAHGQENTSNAKKCLQYSWATPGSSQTQVRYKWVSERPRALGTRKQQTEDRVFPIVNDNDQIDIS